MTWDAPVSGVRLVRNANEARLFVEFLGGVVVDARAAGNEFHLLADTPDGRTVFPFRLRHPLTSSDPTDLGPGTSEVLDPAMLVSHAERVEVDGPSELGPREYRRRLELAAAGLRQAAMAVGPSGALPDGLFLTEAGAAFARRSPERFQLRRLLAESARLRALAAAVAPDDPTSPPPAQSGPDAGRPPERRLSELRAELDQRESGGAPELSALVDRAYAAFSDDPRDQFAALEALRRAGLDAEAVAQRLSAAGLPDSLTAGSTHLQLALIELARRRLGSGDARGAFELLNAGSPTRALRDARLAHLLAIRHDLGDPPPLDTGAADATAGLEAAAPADRAAGVRAVAERGGELASALLQGYDFDPAAQAALARDLAIAAVFGPWRPAATIAADHPSIDETEAVLQVAVDLTRAIFEDRDAQLRKVVPSDHVMSTLSMTRGGKTSELTIITGPVTDAAVTRGLTATQTIEVLGLDVLDTGRRPYLAERPDGTLRPRSEVYFIDTPVTQEMRETFRLTVPPALAATAAELASRSAVAGVFQRRTRPGRPKREIHGFAGLRPLAVDPVGHLAEPCALGSGATLRHRGDDGEFELAAYVVDPSGARGAWIPNTRMTRAQYDRVAAILPRAHREAIEVAIRERSAR